MRMRVPLPNGKYEFKNVSWSDHRNECSKCQEVDLKMTATWSKSCAQGSALLAEKAVKMQIPAEKEKYARELEFAKRAGVFKI